MQDVAGEAPARARLNVAAKDYQPAPGQLSAGGRCAAPSAGLQLRPRPAGRMGSTSRQSAQCCPLRLAPLGPAVQCWTRTCISSSFAQRTVCTGSRGRQAMRARLAGQACRRPRLPQDGTLSSRTRQMQPAPDSMSCFRCALLPAAAVSTGAPKVCSAALAELACLQGVPAGYAPPASFAAGPPGEAPPAPGFGEAVAAAKADAAQPAARGAGRGRRYSAMASGVPAHS